MSQYRPKRGQYTTIHKFGGKQTPHLGEIHPLPVREIGRGRGIVSSNVSRFGPKVPHFSGGVTTLDCTCTPIVWDVAEFAEWCVVAAAVPGEPHWLSLAEPYLTGLSVTRASQSVSNIN